MSKKARTPSFVTEIPLLASAEQEKVLLTRLEAARQVFNACLGEALRRREHLLHSRLYQVARAMKAGKARTEAFAEAQRQVGFGEYALHAYAAQFGHGWLGEHLDSLTVQKLASRAFEAVQHYHWGRRGRPRFKGRQQLDSVEGKTNASGIRWVQASATQGQVEWKRGAEGGTGDLKLGARIDPHDPVIQHGLAAPVKYVRLVRHKLNGRNRFYAQLVCGGKAYRKDKHAIGAGVIGVDIGPVHDRHRRSDAGPLAAVLCRTCPP